MDAPSSIAPEAPATAWSTFSVWMTGPVVSSLGLLLGGIGVALAVYFYLKQKRERVPVYVACTSVIISDESNRRVDAPDKLEVLWNKKPIRQLMVSTVVLGNAGNETIRGSDLPEGQPTLIELSGGEILDYSILETSAPGLAPAIEIVDIRRLRLLFTYLDRGDAISVRVVHTGEPAKMFVTGHVIGAGFWRVAVDKTPRRIVTYLFNILLSIIGGLVLVVLTKTTTPGWFMLILLVIVVFGVYLQFWLEKVLGRFGEPAKLKLRTK